MKRCGIALLAPLLLAVPVAAQRPPAGGASTPADGESEAAPACEAGRIDHIFVDNHSIFDATDRAAAGRMRWAHRVANALHVRTRREVIRRELLFREGDCLDPLLLGESERLLRNLGFLSRVDIFPVAQPDGAVHVVVDTQDEWSTQLDVRVRWDDGPDFRGAALRETNLLGTGRSLGIFYYERGVAQDYGGAYGAPQLLGTRWDLRLAGGRTRAGTFVAQTLAYPFVGETGRWAARQSYVRRDRYFDYVLGDVPPDERHLLVPFVEESWDVAGVARFGRPGRLALVGAALAGENLSFPGGLAATRIARGDDFGSREPAPPGLAALVADQMQALHSLRAYALGGYRSIQWVQRRGLDTFHGQQDVRLGTEFSLALGRSIPVGDRDDDLFATVGLYRGLERGRTLGIGRLRLDARHAFSAPASRPAWEDVFAEAETFVYWRPVPLERHTFFFRATGVGGWNARTPFQLTLGGPRGVRGYARERFPGGRRLVLSVEDRIYFGWPSPDVLDLGATLFADLGRIWPGDVAFGVDSGWRASVGGGLRGSFPAGGRTTYRIDLATPLGEGVSWRAFRLIITVGELHGLSTTFGDVQLLRSRRDGMSGAVLDFPN